jgi:hypothetical protein
MVLAGSVLMATTAHRWNGPFGHGDYGPDDARTKGGFAFAMGFRGYTRTHYRMSRQPPIPRGVNFRFDSPGLTLDPSRILDIAAGNLRNQADTGLEIGGHASAEGDAS